MVYRDTYVEWVWDKHDRDMNVGVGRSGLVYSLDLKIFSDFIHKGYNSNMATARLSLV